MVFNFPAASLAFRDGEDAAAADAGARTFVIRRVSLWIARRSSDSNHQDDRREALKHSQAKRAISAWS
jgi:hypothetical protein